MAHTNSWPPARRPRPPVLDEITAVRDMGHRLGSSQEVLLQLPASVPALTMVRSTLLQSSLDVLRRRGHFARYLELLDRRHRPMLLETLAPEWLPCECAMAHYEACDALDLSESELLAIGEDVGNRIQGTFIGTLVRKARTVGLTPWVPLSQFQRLMERVMQGGAVGLYKRSPKDAMVDVRMVPLARYAYFRAAFCGVITAGIKLGAGRSVTVQSVNTGASAVRTLFKASWV